MPPLEVPFSPPDRRTKPSNHIENQPPVRVNKINNLRELGANHLVNGRRNTPKWAIYARHFTPV
jgi:hypothetical protein